MALDLPVYTKTVWAAEMPITADRMNNLEDTVKVNRDALINHDQVIDSIDTRISDRVNLVTTGIAANAQLGAEAKAEIAQATTGHTPVYTSLDARFQALDDALGYIQVDGNTTAAFYNGHSVSSVVTSMQNLLSGALTEIQNARTDGVTNVQYTSLALHLLNIDQNINLLHANVADINNAAGAGMTLAERINQLQLLQNEIDAAHREVQSGQAADTLAKRFTDLDTQISTLFSNVGNLSDNKVNVSDIINDLIHTDTNKPLSANMGKTLRDLIGGTYDSTNTVTAAITSAASTAEANAKAYADQKDLDANIGEINAAHRDGSDTLDARFDDIETEINTAHRDLGTDPETEEVIVDSLNKRFLDAEADIAALQTEVAATHTENAQNLNTRLTAIETNAAAIASDLHAIATELAMLDDQDAIKDTNTKIDNLEADIQSFARELAMARDDNGRLVETSTRVDSLETQASNMANAISHAASGNDPGGLTERIVALETEPKSATEVVAELPQTGDATKDYLVGPNEDGKYFYYKWIANEWQLISGGGSGNGSSSALIAAALPAAASADENVDYYIGDSTDGYTHYRYIPSSNEGEDGTFISILPSNLVNSVSVGTINVTTVDELGETPATVVPMSGGLVAYDIAHQNNLLANFTAIRYARLKKTYEEDGETLKKQEIVFTYTDGTETSFEIVGGGGGSSAAYTIRLLGGSSFSVPVSQRDVVTISPRPIVNFGTSLAEGISISATVQYKLSTSDTWENASIDIPAITNNVPFDLNVASLLGATGTTTDIRITISTQPDGEGGETYTQYTTYHIDRVEMSITAVNYNPAAIRTGASFQFNYTCIGQGLAKTVYFIIDAGTENEVTLTADVGTRHNRLETQLISLADLATGMHTLQVYFVTSGVRSNVINTYLICNKDDAREVPIVGLAFDAPEINSGDDLIVRYTVYTPGAGIETTDEVVIEAYTMDGSTRTRIASFDLVNVPNATVQQQNIMDYPDAEEGSPYTLYVDVTAKKNGTPVLQETKTASVIVNPYTSKYTLKYEGTENLVYSYNANGRTNNDADKAQFNYVYTAHDRDNTPITFTGAFNNFNWSTDGYCGRSVTTSNDSGTTTTIVHDALTISGGATHTINVPIFASAAQGVSIESDTEYSNSTQNGRTIELDFMVRSATNLNDVIIDCMGSNHAGFRITPQNCYLLNSNVDVVKDDTGAILNEDAIAAAYLNPGVRTHLVFVIEPWAATKAYDQKYHQSVNIYINGEFANACPYNRDNSTGNIVDNFATDATIRIGSESCIIDLFSVKLYNRGLSHTEVLQNYMMAPASRADKLARFEANDVLANDMVNYELAKKKFNCLLLVGPDPVWATNEQGQRYNQMPTISPYKGSPSPINRQKNGEVEGKTESGLIFTMPDPTNSNGYKEEFKLLDKLTDGGYASSNNVQGTSSQKYPIHNLKIYLAKGDGEPDENGLFAKSKKVKYKLPEVGVKGKESTLCWKADYMSTDHANTYNANVVDGLFTDPMSPDWPANWRDNLQYTVHGVRCLLFQQMGSLPPEFIADGCLNNDKGNSKSYGLEYPAPENPEEVDPNAEYDVDGTADTVAQKWEFTNNSDDLGFFKYDSLFLPIGNDQHLRALDAFESCYPDQGDLEDAQDAYKKEHDNVEDPNLNPNYNHLQIVSTWVAQRANYWDETDPDIRATKKNIFKTEFTQHFILDHVLVYYLFSEYIALCDNRVKNMFLRSDTVRKEVIKLKDGSTLFEGNSNPNADLFKEFTQIDTGLTDSETGEPIYVYNMKNADQIDWEASTFAKWAPVLYDLDSCFGVENVGLLKIPYNAGWQYVQNDQHLFNGHDSRFWLMFEDCFGEEIAAKAPTLYNRDRGLNYNTFYQEQIVGNQQAIAPAMTNQDMLLKYDVPWATGFMNYSNKPPTYETPEYKYLQRGSRATQKASFISKRSMLLSSKYQTNSFKNDRISMRYGANVAANDAVINLSANQQFYPAVSFGDNKGWTQANRLVDGTPVVNGLVNAGETCQIKATSDAGGQDTLFIAGASVLTDVGDLSVFKAYEINISAAKNLKKIAFGSHAEGYTNAVTTSIGGLSSCPLLEEINIENCTIFQSLDLSANGLIKRVYASGSGVKSISLPTGGVLNTLEVGAQTNNLTLINQTFLENFSYEDSDNNHYANLNKLWIESTPNVPIVDIITHALDHLTDGVRLTGIDIDLDNDPTFLQTITSDLAYGKYMNSTGTCPPGNTEQPTITGKVHITSIRASLLAKVNEMYPNLIVYNTIDATGEPNNNIIQEYTITYLNYDMDENNPLYVDYRVSGENVIDPVYDVNPITNTYYIDMPTKPEDAQYKYKFGTYDSQNKYRRFSGWVIKNTTTNPTSSTKVNGNVIYVAYFPTVQVQQYTVKWFDAPNGTQLNSVTVDYNADLSAQASPIELGTLARTNVSGNLVKVFSGWSRPLGKITSNVNVYAQWETSTINNDTPSISMSTLTAADVYALSLVDNARKATLLASQRGTPIFIKMGQDFNYTEGVEVTDLLDGDDEIILDGTTDPVRVYNTIKPLAINSDWTFAIDYKLLMDSAASFNNGQEFVLASCYQNANSSIQGFKISVVRGESASEHNIQVTWGTASTVIDFALTDTSAPRYFTSYRNVVVLSHNSDTPNVLRVSYVKPTTNNTYAPINANYGTFVNNELLTWNSNVEIDKPLIIGGNYAGMTTTIEEEDYTRRPAQGIVYWAKFWNTDLGETNCGKLASWIHETVPFLLSGYNDGASSATEQIYTGSELSFVAAQGMGDRYLYARRNNGATDSEGYYGWHLSDARTICNSLIYSGMPEAYKSIIRSTPVRSVKRDIELRTNTYGTTNDYLFLPAYREVYEGATSDGYGGTEIQAAWSSPWHWMVPANLTILTYQAGSSQNVESRAASSLAPYRYRFSGAYISDNNRIFDIDDDPTGKTLYYVNNGATSTITVQPGDIWVTQDNTAYMYLSRIDIERGVSYDTMAANNTGAWKRANMWNLRTFSASTSAVENGFMRVNVDGAVETQIVVTQFATEGRLLCPEFTV